MDSELSATSPRGVWEAAFGPSLDTMTAVSKMSAANTIASPREHIERSRPSQTLALKKPCAVKLLDVYLL